MLLPNEAVNISSQVQYLRVWMNLSYIIPLCLQGKFTTDNSSLFVWRLSEKGKNKDAGVTIKSALLMLLPNEAVNISSQVQYLWVRTNLSYFIPLYPQRNFRTAKHSSLFVWRLSEKGKNKDAGVIIKSALLTLWPNEVVNISSQVQYLWVRMNLSYFIPLHPQRNFSMDKHSSMFVGRLSEKGKNNDAGVTIKSALLMLLPNEAVNISSQVQYLRVRTRLY